MFRLLILTVFLTSCASEPASTQKITINVTIQQKATTEQASRFWQLLDQAAFDSVDMRIKSLALAVDMSAVQAEAQVYSFDEAMDSHEVRARIYKKAHVPGSIQHLLKYAADHPDEQRLGPITELQVGFWDEAKSQHFFPVLVGNQKNRALEIRPEPKKWEAGTKFVAIPIAAEDTIMCVSSPPLPAP